MLRAPCALALRHVMCAIHVSMRNAVVLCTHPASVAHKARVRIVFQLCTYFRVQPQLALEINEVL